MGFITNPLILTFEPKVLTSCGHPSSCSFLEIWQSAVRSEDFFDFSNLVANGSPSKTLVVIGYNQEHIGFFGGWKMDFETQNRFSNLWYWGNFAWSVGIFMYFPTKNSGAIWNPESLKSQDYFHLAESIITKSSPPSPTFMKVFLLPKSQGGEQKTKRIVPKER